jgi:AraC-like DNA-binding protein
MEPHDDVRVWRPEAVGAGLCMHGTTSSYAVDPVGEYVVGMVLAGAMEVRRGGERHVFVAGDLCAWDPSARHAGRSWGCERWEARLIVLELPALEEIVRDPEGAGSDVEFATPLVRDPRLARRFLALHAALEAPAWAQLAAAAGVSRHRLTRLFRAAYGLPPHRFQLAQRIRVARAMLERGVAVGDVAQQTGFFDQSHLHRHFRGTLGITPGQYSAAVRSGVQDARGIAA